MSIFVAARLIYPVLTACGSSLTKEPGAGAFKRIAAISLNLGGPLLLTNDLPAQYFNFGPIPRGRRITYTLVPYLVVQLVSVFAIVLSMYFLMV